MEYNLQVRLNEAVNFWNHFLAHFDSGDFASIYNHDYLKKIEHYRESLIFQKKGELATLLLPYYQKLCFLPYFGINSIEALINFVADEDKFLNFVATFQKQYRPEDLRLLSAKIAALLKEDYQKFYKNYWLRNLDEFKKRQKWLVDEASEIVPAGLYYFSKVNPEIKIGEVNIFLAEALGTRGKGLGISGCAVGLPASEKEALGGVVTILHELGHAFLDPFFKKLGYQYEGEPRPDNRAHLAREAAVNYLIETFWRRSGGKISQELTPAQKKLIPFQIKKLIEQEEAWRHLAFFGIKTLPLGPVKSYVLLGKKLKWCPDFFVLEKKENFFLAYSPLVNRLYLIDARYAPDIGQKDLGWEKERVLAAAQLLIPEDKDLTPHHHRSLTARHLRFHLTSDCNLRCVYCYLKAGEEKKKTRVEVIKKAIDKFANTKEEHVIIEFHGGGEPTLEFQTIKEIVNYCRSKIKKPLFYLQTNGLFSDEALNYLIKNDFRVSFSLDGPPFIQKRQRPAPQNDEKSLVIIEKNIRALIKAGLKVMSISVITAYSQKYLKEIFWYLYQLGIRRMMFNPLSALGRAEKQNSPETSAPQLADFVRDFLILSELAGWMGALVISDFLPKFLEKHQAEEIVCGACQPDINLSEEGHLVACTRTLALKPAPENPFVYGSYDEARQDFILDETKINNLRSRTVRNMKTADGTPGACENCLIKWDCAGDCLNELYILKEDFYKIAPNRCEAKRLYAKNYLRFLASREFIGIKPFIKQDGEKLMLTGYFSQFRLGQGTAAEELEANPYLKISLAKDSLKAIYQKIIAYQKKFPRQPILFLLSIEEDATSQKVSLTLQSFIKALKQSGLLFKIVKPLARVLPEEFQTSYHLASSCFDCLALFEVTGERVVFCNSLQGKKLAEYADREEIFNEFSGENKECPNLKI